MSQLTLPLSISLHLSVFLSRPYEADGGPPEFGSARGFYPLGIFFFRPLLLCACSRGISWFSLWWCKAPRDAFECDLALEVDEVIGCFERSSVMKWWLHSIYGQIR